MPNTYTQLLIHLVFAVKGRDNLIKDTFRENLERYICGIVKGRQSKPLAIYCNPDHTHLLIGLNPKISISDLVRTIKIDSSKWINSNKLTLGKFSWQEGYGAFSHSRSQLDIVVQYIMNQQDHHKKRSFKDEYKILLEKFGIEYNLDYLFDFD